MAQLRKTAQARRDLLDIWLHIALDDPAAADRVFDRLEARIMALGRFPELGPARPDVAADARALVDPPYLVLYRILPESVQIVRVLHAARRIDAMLLAEGLE